MINEPYNALLWHNAAVLMACSSEVAQTGSRLLKDLAPCLNRKIYGIGTFTQPANLTLIDLKNNEPLGLIRSSEGFWQLISSSNTSPLEIHSVDESIRVVNQELEALIDQVQDGQYDVNTWVDLNYTPDYSLKLLNLFDPRGLDKLIQLGSMVSKVSFIGAGTIPFSVTTSKNTNELFHQINNLGSRGQKILTNALIYRAQQTVVRTRN